MTKKVLIIGLAFLLLTAFVSPAFAIDVESVTLYGAKSLIAGKSARIEAIINPQNATAQELIWTSSNPLAATVNDKGTVTAQDVDDYTDVIITAAAPSGKEGAHEIRVCPRARSVEISPSGNISFDISNDGYLQFTATVSPSNATQEVVWSVSNRKVADITDGGLLSGKKKGVVTVRAKVLGEESVMASARVEISRLASSITIKGATRLVSGKKTKLVCTMIPKVNKKSAVIWECLTPEIAKVSTSGKVTALSVTEEQVAVIKATAKNNPLISATHDITISPAQQ